MTRSEIERVGVTCGSKSSNDVRVGDGGTDKTKGGGDGGGRVEDVTIFVRRDKKGQYQEWTRSRSEGQRSWDGLFGDARLRWFGHVRRKDDGYIGSTVLSMELPGMRKRGRPKMRFMDAMRERTCQWLK